MTKTNRRTFLRQSSLLVAGLAFQPVSAVAKKEIITVQGRIRPRQLGTTLIHEHLLVDFIGAAETGPHRWDRAEVRQVVLPYLQELKSRGCDTLVDCTPGYLGRDVRLLQELAEASGIQILTNTGYYGARDNQHLPPHAFDESADELAARWVQEFEQGIDGTSVRPGFMKIGVNSGELSEIHQKLITAAARTHKQTGLTIASHTGPAVPAFQQLEILKSEGVQADAFIWVHAQNEQNWEKHTEAARLGAWVSLDGVHKDRIEQYVAMLTNLRKANLLHRTLLSHDAGWYSPGEPNGGNFRGFTDLFDHLLPALAKAGFRKRDVRQLLKHNPRTVFQIQKRLL